MIFFLPIAISGMATSVFAQSDTPISAQQVQEERWVRDFNAILPESWGLYATLSSEIFSNGLRAQFPDAHFYGFTGLPSSSNWFSPIIYYWKIVVGGSHYRQLIIADPSGIRLNNAFATNLTLGVIVYETVDEHNHALRVFPKIGVGAYNMVRDSLIGDIYQLHFQCGVGALYSVAIAHRAVGNRKLFFSLPLRIDIGYEQHYAARGVDRLENVSGFGGVFLRLSLGLGFHLPKNEYVNTP